MIPSLRPGPPRLLSLSAALLLAAFVSPAPADDPAAAPAKPLIGAGVPDWEKTVASNAPAGGAQPDVALVPGADGVAVSIQASGPSGFPGLRVQPPAPWDLSAYGRVDAVVANTCQRPLRLSIRVDDATGETGAATVALKPGETQTLPLYLGYASTKARLKASAIASVLLFVGKAPEAQSFRLVRLEAAGPAGDKPPVDPKTVAVRPANGLLCGPGLAVTPAQLAVTGGAKAAPDGDGIKIDFAGGKDEAATLRPEAGMWNLNDAVAVRVRVANTGSSPAAPAFRLESKDGPGDIVAAPPLAPGASAEVVLPFAAAVPWQGPDDPAIADPEAHKTFPGKPGTGTSFVSHHATGLTLLSDKTPGAKTFRLESAAAEAPPAADLPAWLGQRPPVDGEWTQTFDENFDGGAVDLTKWNIYAPNFWDTRTHFSKDNAIVKDGALILRVERKTGRQNDDPNGKETDYATGFADTYGKWTQRYGYFEARVKLPKAPCLWPAFWLMPDRGLASGDQGHRQSTRNGGMELDIVEQLSAWGPYRFNLAFHWDGYGKTHKATGCERNYVAPDKDGFITVGLLWTPGALVLYGNGKESARWENPRVCSVESDILLDNVTGGWETEALDDAQLPGDFVVDYVRVWQRKDLASPEDGPKPNQGTPAAPGS